MPRGGVPRPAFHVDDPVAVGRRIRDLRQQRGLSLRQIAGPGCSPGYLSRVERGQRIPSVTVMADLAEKLGVTLEDLGGRDIRTRVPETRLLDLELAARMGEESAGEDVRRTLDDARRIGDRRAESRLLEVLAHLAAEARRDGEAVRLVRAGDRGGAGAGVEPRAAGAARGARAGVRGTGPDEPFHRGAPRGIRRRADRAG